MVVETSWLARAVNAALIATGGAVLIKWLFLAVVHMGSRFRVGHAQGVWMALAQYVNIDGIYPPLSDGEYYGGTRHLPIPFVLHGWLARLTDEYLVSGKLIALASMLLLLVLVFIALRRLIGCPAPVAFGLTATVLASEAGLLGGLTIGGDVLPVVLQLSAVLLLLRNQRRSAIVAAALLCGLALLSKLNAVWAPVAIVIWLWFVARRLALVFSAAFVAIAALGVITLNLLSEGRMLENVVGFAASGVRGRSDFVDAPLRLLGFLFTDAAGVAILLPIVIFGFMYARRSWHPNLLVIALGVAALVLLGTYVDVGASTNHLLDVVVLTALVTGQLVASVGGSAAGASVLVYLTAVAIAWVNVSSIGLVMGFELKEAIGIVRTGSRPYPRDPLAGRVPPGATILSEDPGIVVARGERPVVLDPFTLRDLAQRDPLLIEGLVRRIDGKEFDRIVTVESLGGHNLWWYEFHFGRRVVEAMRRSYEFDSPLEGYFMHHPK